jgi:membrane associated rhomboid family serine protease
MVAQKKDYVRIFSHALLHADWMHLIVNMFVLYMFGNIVERYFSVLFPQLGKFLFMVMYIAAVPVSTIPSLMKHRNDQTYNSVGASGAVSAILFASILFEPTSRIGFLFLPIPIPAPVFGIIYLAYSWYMSKKGIDNIGHDAHFAGSVFGFLFPLILQPMLILRFFDLIFN